MSDQIITPFPDKRINLPELSVSLLVNTIVQLEEDLEAAKAGLLVKDAQLQQLEAKLNRLENNP